MPYSNIASVRAAKASTADARRSPFRTLTALLRPSTLRGLRSPAAIETHWRSIRANAAFDRLNRLPKIRSVLYRLRKQRAAATVEELILELRLLGVIVEAAEEWELAAQDVYGLQAFPPRRYATTRNLAKRLQKSLASDDERGSVLPLAMDNYAGFVGDLKELIERLDELAKPPKRHAPLSATRYWARRIGHQFRSLTGDVREDDLILLLETFAPTADAVTRRRAIRELHREATSKS